MKSKKEVGQNLSIFVMRIKENSKLTIAIPRGE